MDINEKITALQGEENTAVWMVGEQLKDICKDARCAELVGHDLDNEKMSLAECEKKIKAYADAHKKGGFSCVIPSVADKIIRDFYGLPSGGDKAEESNKPGILDLESFI